MDNHEILIGEEWFVPDYSTAYPEKEGWLLWKFDDGSQGASRPGEWRFIKEE